MSNLKNSYDLIEDKTENDLKFFFVSMGHQEIIKAVHYSYIQKLNGKNVYNLGFGDYNFQEDTFYDNVNTNNGDVYWVFNTVLKTIPLFFEYFSNQILIVQGSDSRPEFVEQCVITCEKKCKDGCKNYNRRINIYKRYVDQNFQNLSTDYQFYGGVKNDQFEIILVPYELNNRYDSVFLFKNI